MKTAVFSVAAAALFELAVAQPHRAMQHRAHQAAHVKRDDVVTVTNTVFASPSEIVVVVADNFGNVISTYTTTEAASTYAAPAATSSAAIVAAIAAPTSSSVYTPSTSSSVYVAPSSSSVYVVPSSSSVYVAPSSSAASSSAAASSSSSSSASGFGIAYSPYNSDGSCKTQSQVTEDFETIGGSYSVVRTYGTDCDQTALVLNAASSYGMKLFAGVYDLDSLESEINLIISAANGDWSSFDTIAIGNELVNSGTASASTVVSAISSARSLLTAAGYTGYVVTVDTLVASREYPELCDNSDYCAVNSHPFFDGATAAADSGSFLTTQTATLAAVLANSNQRIVITETGWPWQGETNGVAVPSVSNQEAAVASIQEAYASNPSDLILFTAFNDYWKTSDASQFDAEPYWGIHGDCPSG